MVPKEVRTGTGLGQRSTKACRLIRRKESALDADWDEGKARGVVGSPHFFTDDGGNWFCPSLAISRDDVGNFVVAWKQGTEDFVGRAFGVSRG